MARWIAARVCRERSDTLGFEVGDWEQMPEAVRGRWLAEARELIAAASLPTGGGRAVGGVDAELVVAQVAALPAEMVRELAKGPMAGDETPGCRVCAVLKDDGFATGGYRGGERAAPDWLLNWHRSHPVLCGVVYGIAMALAEQAKRPASSTGDGERGLSSQPFDASGARKALLDAACRFVDGARIARQFNVNTLADALYEWSRRAHRAADSLTAASSSSGEGAGCPDDAACERCENAAEDDVCFPDERRQAELTERAAESGARAISRLYIGNNSDAEEWHEAATVAVRAAWPMFVALTAPPSSGETDGKHRSWPHREVRELMGELMDVGRELDAATDRAGKRLREVYDSGQRLADEIMRAAPPPAGETGDGRELREWTIARLAGYDGPAAWIVVQNDRAAEQLGEDWAESKEIELVRVREVPAPSSSTTEDGS